MKLLQIHSCSLCKHINGYKSHCLHKTIKFKEIYVDIFSSIPDWCPLPDASQSVQSVVDIKKLQPILWPVCGDIPKTINCPTCGTICRK